MRDQLRPALALAAVLAGLLCSGCGSSSTPTITTHANGADATATKAQFIAQAEHICSTLATDELPLKARQESLKKLPAAAADKAFVSLVHQLVALSRTAAAKLAALPRPAQDAAAIEKLLSSFSEETSEATSIADAASRQESAPGEAAEDALRRSVAKNRVLAEQYGMKDCIGSE
jgi:hypothetical protein